VPNLARPNDSPWLDAIARMDVQAVGQMMEFLVWAELIGQSRGALHVFLPVLDRGLDAVIHRRTDGTYIPIQVKCRTEAINGFVEIGIPAHALVDDRALIIAGLLNNEGSRPVLGPMLLVVDQATFKRVAAQSLVKGEGVYTASFSMDSAKSHWRPYLVSRDELADRLLGPAKPAEFEVLSREETDDYTSWVGSVGEQEVLERVSYVDDVSLFRPFPDLETVEVLVRNNVSGGFLGLQVKTAVPDPQRHGEARISIRKASFLPAPSTYLVALAFQPEQKRFEDECLVVPSEQLLEVAVDSGEHWVLNFRPHSQERSSLDPYRHPLSTLGSVVERLIT
jgi:hypothetical protein